jgi:hypothetical protein
VIGEKTLLFSQKHTFANCNIQINFYKVKYYSIDKVNNILCQQQAQHENFKEQQGFYEHRQVFCHKNLA